MDIAFIDQLAANGRTPMHSAPAVAKLISSGLLLAAAISASTPIAAGAVVAAVAGLCLATRQRLQPLVTMALYPVVFAVIFAMGWITSAPAFAAVIVLRALSAGLIAALLITTTTFVDIFAVISRFMPGPVGDGLFMAYRAFFILLDELGQITQAIRLRGGAGPTLGIQLRTYGEALGLVVIHATDMTERMYRMMVVRGYSGRIQSSQPAQSMTALHYAIVAYSGAVLALILASRRFTA